MNALFILINIIVLSFAVVGPWATITAFEAGRATGWMMAFATVVSHAYTWYAMSQNSEILFFFGPLFGGYEFICTFAPLGLDEEEVTNEG